MREMLVGAGLTVGFALYAFGIYLNNAPIRHALTALLWSF